MLVVSLEFVEFVEFVGLLSSRYSLCTLLDACIHIYLYLRVIHTAREGRRGTAWISSTPYEFHGFDEFGEVDHCFAWSHACTPVCASTNSVRTRTNSRRIRGRKYEFGPEFVSETEPGTP